jgi:hypothetical protein
MLTHIVSESVYFNTLNSMRRSLFTFAFALLFVIGVSDVNAQSTDALERSVQSSATVQQSAVMQKAPQPPALNTRQDIQQAMLADMDMTSTQGPAAMQTDGNSNRKLLYIAGGTLVAAGITTAIILLLSGEDDGIPGPPGRPAGQ